MLNESEGGLFQLVIYTYNKYHYHVVNLYLNGNKYKKHSRRNHMVFRSSNPLHFFFANIDIMQAFKMAVEFSLMISSPLYIASNVNYMIIFIRLLRLIEKGLLPFVLMLYYTI